MSDAPEELLQALVSLPFSLTCALHQKVRGHSRHTESTDAGETLARSIHAHSVITTAYSTSKCTMLFTNKVMQLS